MKSIIAHRQVLSSPSPSPLIKRRAHRHNSHKNASLFPVVYHRKEEKDAKNEEKEEECNSNNLGTALGRRSSLLFFSVTAFAATTTAVATESSIAADGGEATIRNPQDLGNGYKRFYGEATSSSSYGGYGGSDNNFDKFKYFFDVPTSYEKDTVNKVEKSTNGTDARWLNPRFKQERAYCVTLPGYTKMKEDRMGILSDLALSDYVLQDALYTQDEK